METEADIEKGVLQKIDILQNCCSTEYKADCMRLYDQNLNKILGKKFNFFKSGRHKPATLKRIGHFHRHILIRLEQLFYRRYPSGCS